MACPDNKPCGCVDTECGCAKSASEIAYIGPSLKCIGIENCDKLNIIVAKFDSFLCSGAFIESLINNIINNVELYNQFATIINNSIECDTIQNCITTSTTTTCMCNEYRFEVIEGVLVPQDVAYFDCGNTTSLMVQTIQVGEPIVLCIQNSLGIAVSDKVSKTLMNCCNPKPN